MDDSVESRIRHKRQLRVPIRGVLGLRTQIEGLLFAAQVGD